MQPKPAHDVADALVATAPLATRWIQRLLAALEHDGLVERTPASDDRRRLDLALTARGRRTLASAQTSLGERIGELLGGIPRPEANALARALAQVESLLAGTPPPRRPPPPPKHPPPHRR